MACDQAIGSPVTATLDCTSGVWQDSGMVVGAGECLLITAPSATVKWGVNPDQCAYPEGWYSLSGAPCGPQTYDPSQTYGVFGGDGGNPYTTLEGVPYSLIAKIANAQPSGTHLTGTLRPNRSTLFPSGSLSGGGRVWLNFNDNIYSDNSGQWQVTLQRYFTPPPYAVITLGGSSGAGQGVRFSPMTEQVYQALTVTFPLGYAVGTDLSTQPGLFHTTFTSVRVRGPYRAYLVGQVLHVCNDSGELTSGTALDGVDFLRIGT